MAELKMPHPGHDVRLCFLENIGYLQLNLIEMGINTKEGYKNLSRDATFFCKKWGRADDMFIIRGENVYPSAIEDVIRGIEGFGDEYRIVITREKTMDEMIVQAEYVKGIDPGRIPQLQKKLESELKARGLRSIVQMMEPDRLERTEFKARRIIDKRGLYDEMMKQ